MNLIGQILLGGFFIIMGINHFRKKKEVLKYAKEKKVPKPKVAVPFTGVMLIVGGLGIFIGLGGLAKAILILFLVPTSFIVHKFWEEKDTKERFNQMIYFMYNMALIGALLMI